MSVSCHLLLLLIPVLSLCGATEYYVRPTEPTNTSCPAQPCLTLSQYINDSHHYFQSNTVFRFLPGIHLMDRPLHIGDVHNMSLENFNHNNDYPYIMANILCVRKELFAGAFVEDNIEVKCAAVRLCNVHKVTFKEISIIVLSPDTSGIVVQYASNIHIHLNILCYQMSSQQLDTRIGILVFQASNVEVHSSYVVQCSSGLVLHKTNNIFIMNTTTKLNGNFYSTLYRTAGVGVFLLSTTNAFIIDTHAMYNDWIGMVLINTYNATVLNTVLFHNAAGISVNGCTRISIMNATVMQNHCGGMNVVSTTRISIINTTVMANDCDGIVLRYTTGSNIMRVIVSFTEFGGILLEVNSRLSIIDTAVTNNYRGIGLFNTRKSSIINTTVSQHVNEGMSIWKTSKISINNIDVFQFGRDGIWMNDTTRTRIINARYVSDDADSDRGMYLKQTSRAYVIDASLIHRKFTMYSCTSITVTNATMRNCDDGMHIVNTSRSSVISTTFVNNTYHGIAIVDTGRVKIINTTVMYNGWNGMYIERATRTSIINTTAKKNSFSGLYLLYTARSNIINTTVMHNGYDGMNLVRIDRLSIINSTAMHNLDTGITAYYILGTTMINVNATGNGNGGMFLYHANNINNTNVSLMDNGWRREITTFRGGAISTTDLNSLPAAVILYYTSLHVSGWNVTWNSVSAVKAYASTLTVSGDVVISSNRAMYGAAFTFIQNSNMELTENAHIKIRNNHAIDTGGAFYIVSDLYYSYTGFDLFVANNSCFFNTKRSRSQIRLTFVNNSAGKGGDILYGGHVFYGLDGDWNCLLSLKNISNISQDGLSLIASEPSRVCLCNETGQPDCLIVADPAPHSIYPGQLLSIDVVVVGQEFGTVSGSVYAQFVHKGTGGSPQLGTGQKVQSVTQEKCNHLHFTIFPPGDMSEGVLVLTTDNRIVSQFVPFKEYKWKSKEKMKDFYHVSDASTLNPTIYSHYPVYVNLTFLPCPAGFMLTLKPPFKCDCNQLLQQFHGIECNIQEQTISRSGYGWVGTLKDDNGTLVAAEYCLFDYCNKGDVDVTLSDPDSQCNYNHSGTLCGGCQPGLSLALGSAQCLPCSNIYLALLIPFALAGFVVVLFIKILDLTISQGTINGLIFYANVIKANQHAFLPQGQTNPLTLFITWFNLDLGVETCFFHGLTAYTKTWLQLVFPLYIWSIAGLIIILAKYSDRVAKVMGNNTVPVLATLFLLSYAKLFRTIITALSYTMLYSSQGHKAVWSADGNVDYLGPKHAPLFATAVAVLLFLWLPYTLLLFLGQWLHRCNIRLIDRTLMKIKPFLDAHYGPLKGKHCYWFGVLLFVRAEILLISALIPTNHANIVYICSSVSAIVLTYFGIAVYSSIIMAMFDIIFFMNLALLGVANLFIARSGGEQEVAAYTLIGIAFAQFLGLVIFKVFNILKRSKKVMSWLHKRQPAEDELELNELAPPQ